MNANEIKVDKEFHSLVPPLSEEECEGLKKSILAEGCRDELIVWGDVLLDGHNRLAICQKHGIKYMVRYMDFPDRDTAKLWIICNQLSRRNLTPENKTYLIGIKYKLEKKEEHSGVQNDLHPGRTAERIAEEFNVSPATVKRAEKFAEAVAALPEEKRKGVLSGKNKMTKGEIINLGKKEKEVKEEELPAESEDEEPEALSQGKKRMGSYWVKIRLEGNNIKSVQKAAEKAFPKGNVEVEKIDLTASRAVRLGKAENLLEEAKLIVGELRDEMENWRESLPENLQGSGKADQIDECISGLEEIESNMENCDFSSVEFPSMMG